MKYAAQGKRSLAWWLQAVKWFGKDGNKGIMRGGEVPTHQVKFAMEDLLSRYYISRSGGGRGKRDLAYHLTETGGRYLDEHEAELEAPVEDAPPPAVRAAFSLRAWRCCNQCPSFRAGNTRMERATYAC